MEITDEVIRKSVASEPFGLVEPFITGDERAVEAWHARVLAGLGRSPLLRVDRESDHYGSGYASYVSAFISPRDGRSVVEHPTFVDTIGILLYLSRLAPIAVFGSSSRNKNNSGSSSGFIEINNLNRPPEGDWSDFMREVRALLEGHGIELLDREPLERPVPRDVVIPTCFDGPYRVFDTLFYWCD